MSLFCQKWTDIILYQRLICHANLQQSVDFSVTIQYFFILHLYYVINLQRWNGEFWHLPLFQYRSLPHVLVMTFKLRLDLKYFCQIDKLYVGQSISRCAFNCSKSLNIQCKSSEHTHHVHTCTVSIFKTILQKIRRTVSYYLNFTRHVCQSSLKSFKQHLVWLLSV